MSLVASPSPLRPIAWASLLRDYPGPLPSLIDGILRHGAQIGYKGPEQLILSENLSSALKAPTVIEDQLVKDISLGRIRAALPEAPFISSPLGLMPKSNFGYRRIHHLSHPPLTSVNDQIPHEYAAIQYARFDDIVASILAAGRGSIIMKWDVKDAFRLIPVAPNNLWLLGLFWAQTYYVERVLSFGLRTAPMLFNLFGEAFHWILQRHGFKHLHHYLDDFIFILPPSLVAQTS